MTAVAPSALSLIGAGYYAVIVAICALALRASWTSASWHRIVWFGLIVLFISLIAMRVHAFEDSLRSELRDVLKVQGAYSNRRVIQFAFTGIFALGLAAGFLLFWHHFRRRLIETADRYCFTALLGGCAMVALIAIRIISWHATDFLLYGPAKLNWFFDLGLATLVGGCGMLYCRQRIALRH